MVLDPPTPMQWKALQECVVLHRNQFQTQRGQNGARSTNTATIDAAPLIAIIDEASGETYVRFLSISFSWIVFILDLSIDFNVFCLDFIYDYLIFIHP